MDGPSWGCSLGTIPLLKPLQPTTARLSRVGGSTLFDEDAPVRRGRWGSGRSCELQSSPGSGVGGIGFSEPKLRVLDKATGKQIWEVTLPRPHQRRADEL